MVVGASVVVGAAVVVVLSPGTVVVALDGEVTPVSVPPVERFSDELGRSTTTRTMSAMTTATAAIATRMRRRRYTRRCASPGRARRWPRPAVVSANAVSSVWSRSSPTSRPERSSVPASWSRIAAVPSSSPNVRSISGASSPSE